MERNIWSRLIEMLKVTTRPYRLKYIFEKEKMRYRRLFSMSDEKFKKKYIRGGEIQCTRFDDKNKKRHLIFVIELLSPRVIKMAKTLKNNGWKIVAVLTANCTISSNSNQLAECFFAVVKCSDFRDLCSTLFEYKDQAALVHYFTQFCGNVNILLSHKQFFPKIVVEMYDIQNGLYRIRDERSKRIHEMERYALEHADGICQREFALDYLKEKGYKLSPYTVTFLDYLDELVLPEDGCRTNELAFVYVGGVAIDRKATPLACHLEAAEYLARHKCHYHMYPSMWDEDVLRDLLRFDQECEYFHLHKPVVYEELLGEISKYDYGIFPLFKDYREVENNDYTEAKYIYGSTNKFFDFLSAGLPIVGKILKKQIEELGKHGAVFQWTMEEIDFDYLREHRVELKKKVVENRDYWMMENRIQELIDFYDNVAEA